MTSMTQEEISASNAKKLDHIVWLLDGDVNNPGLVHKVGEIVETLYGIKGSGGLVNRVNTMWRVHVWILCSLSGAGGVLGTLIMQKMIKP